VLDDAAAFLRDELGYVDVSIQTSSAAEAVVRGDAQLLAVVFRNIYLNAAQAMHGGGKIRATARVADDDRCCRVRVADSGPGISAALRATVFEPFFTTKVNGTGLGLSIAHRIVAAHGGSIAVRCPSHGGGLLEVSLPSWRS